MIIDDPSTSAHAVAKRLVDLRTKHGAVALGRVLTLALVVDEQHAEDAIESANEASHEHPCRILAVVRGTPDGPARLDAQIRIGGDAGAGEVVVLRTFGDLTAYPESVVTPLLLPDNPIVVWWPAQAPAVPSDDPVGRLAQRRITDAAACDDPLASLAERAADYRPGDTDLAWTRLTLWRALLAAALDQPPHDAVTSAEVVGGADNPSADLLAAWLAWALRCPVTLVNDSSADALRRVRLDRESGPVIIDRPHDDGVATLATAGQADRPVSLPRRSAAECLAEELRRLDPDDIYGEVLAAGLPLLRTNGATDAATATVDQ